MLHQPDPAPRFSECEVVTLALSQERTGEPREDHMFRVHQARVLPFFPGLNERSRPTRRTRDRWSVILAVRGRVQIALDAPVPCVSDSREQRHRTFVGTANDGVWSRKALMSCGYTRYRVVRLTGVLIGFVLAPASPSDHQPVVARLDAFPSHLTHVLARAYSVFVW